MDEDGYLYLDGRREDLIITGGVNVYPLEVEQALREHPGVEDVAVFGVPDDGWGQRVCAAVVGTAARRSWRRTPGSGSPAEAPQDLGFLDDLPRTLTGKARRDRLAATVSPSPEARSAAPVDCGVAEDYASRPGEVVAQGGRVAEADLVGDLVDRVVRELEQLLGGLDPLRGDPGVRGWPVSARNRRANVRGDM